MDSNKILDIVMRVISGLLLAGLGWSIGAIIESDRRLDLVERELKVRLETVERAKIHLRQEGELLKRIEQVERDMTFLRNKMLELHPMQRSTLADLFTQTGADCRDDWDCNEGCICVDRRCECGP